MYYYKKKGKDIVKYEIEIDQEKLNKLEKNRGNKNEQPRIKIDAKLPT